MSGFNSTKEYREALQKQAEQEQDAKAAARKAACPNPSAVNEYCRKGCMKSRSAMDANCHRKCMGNSGCSGYY